METIQTRSWASAVWALSIVALLAPAVVETRTGLVDAIAPAAATIGERVTITGHGFGAHNVRVTVGGIRATVVAANGYKVTFIVPTGVPAGPTTVIVRNPGGRSGSIAFTVLGGPSSPPGPPASGPPDIVSEESARASSATISEAGGVVMATATNGTAYTLSIPPGGVLSDTLVTLTPIATTVPFSGASIAVRLQPSGLRLLRPAILEITPAAGAAAALDAALSTVNLARSGPGALESRLARWRLFLRWLREKHHPQPPPNPDPPDPGTPTDRTLGFIFDDEGTNFEVLPVVTDGTTLAIEVAHFSAAGTAGATAADFAATIQPLINALPSTLPPTQVASLVSSLVSWLQPPPGGEPGFDLCTTTTICQQVFQIATDSLLAHRDQACSVAQGFVQSGEPFLAREALSQVARIGARLVELGNLAEQASVPGFEQTFDFTCIADSLNSIVDLVREQVLDNPRGGLLALLPDLAADAQLLELTDQHAYALTATSEVLNMLLERAISRCLLDADVVVGESLIELIQRVFPDTFLEGIDPGLAGRLTGAFTECRIRIEPAVTNVGAGQVVQFTGTAVGLTPPDVTWSVSGGGSINPQSGVFTAGPSAGTSTITATSVVATPVRRKSASVTVVNVSVSVNPFSSTIAPGGTRQFSVTVTGLSNLDVVWSATRGTIDPQTGFFTAPATAGPVTIRATSVVAPVFGEAVVSVVVSNGTITSLNHVTFIGACASADLQVLTSGFVNPAMTFTVQGPGTLRNQTLIGTTTFTTWRAANGASGEIVITAASVENPTVTRTATFRVDPFVAAYGGSSSGTAFVVRGVDAGLPDDTYRIALTASGGASGTYIATPGGGGLSGTAANGNTISVSISSSVMEGTVNVVGGPPVSIALSHNCAPQ